MKFYIFKKYGKELLTLALPSSIAQAGMMITNVVDTYMIGKISLTALAAAAFAGNLSLLFIVFGTGFSYGLTPYIGTAQSQGNRILVAKTLKNGLLLCIAIGFIMTIISSSFTFVLPFLGQEKEVVTLAQPYFFVLSLSMLPNLIFMGLRQYTDAMHYTKASMYIIAVINIFNIIANILFIYGGLGIPPLGLLGAGIATLLSRILMVILMIAYIMNVKALKIRFIMMMRVRYKSSMIRKIMQVGTPSAFLAFIEVGAVATAGIFAGIINKEALAAYQIGIILCGFTFLVSSGISQSTTILISTYFGKNQLSSIKNISKVSLYIELIFILSCSLLIYIGKDFIPLFFIEKGENSTVSIASNAMWAVVIYIILDGLQIVTLGILRAFKDVFFPAGMALIGFWIFGIPFSYIAVNFLDMPLDSIWFGLCIGHTILISGGILRIIYKFKKLNL